jgi:putative heme iron utilization protein
MRTDHDPPSTAATAASGHVAPVVLGREPSDAEHARTLAAAVTTGVLSTLARDPAGVPFGSLAPFGLDPLARPVLCISELAEHTRNLQVDTRSSLLVTRPAAAGVDPLAQARLTLVGHTVPVPEGDVEAARAAHLAANPHAAGYVDFGDFSLWRLEIDVVRYVGGYGHMSWVDVDAWRVAEPDPVAAVAAGAIEHLNADHADACLLMAQRLGGRPDAVTAVVTTLDRYGLDLLATGPDGAGRVRLGFDEPVTTAPEIRTATVALTRRARG